MTPSLKAQIYFVSDNSLFVIRYVTLFPTQDWNRSKEPTFNKEPSPDNAEVTALELIPPQYGAGEFNENGG